MTDMTDDQVKALLDGATPGRRVQFHGSYCPEAVGTPFTDWDTSHDMSVIRPDGSRYRLAHYKHASDAYLSQMAPDLARALLDARAELARVRADAQAAVARAYEAAAERLDLAEHDAEERDWRSGANAFAALAKGLRALAPADGLAEVQALRVEARENAMQALASMGQAQEAYEAQLEAEAELAAAQQREAEWHDGSRPLPFDRDTVGRMVRDAWVRWAETQPSPKPSWLAPYDELNEADKEADRQIGEAVARWTLVFDAARAALAPTPPADTWHERRTMLPDGDARKGEG